MGRFAGYQTGKKLPDWEPRLDGGLEKLQANETFEGELRRRPRVSEDLQRMREDLQARRVKLPSPPPIPPRLFPAPRHFASLGLAFWEWGVRNRRRIC